jgi:hypothetical protein
MIENESLPEYIAAIGEESPAQELVCDDNLTEYHGSHQLTCA